eukprot:1027393_1
MELQCMTSALQLIQGNKRKRRKSRSKSKSSDRLSSQIESYYTESKLSREEEVARTELMWNLDRLWKKVLFESSPSAAAAASDDAHTFITLFGSVATHLEDRAAKSIDIYLKVPSQLNSNELQKDQNELLKHLATELNANGLTSSGIVDCTAPSIAVMVDETHIHICYDEHNDKSKMVQLVNALCQYKEHDTRIKALIVCIKHWSKQRNLNSSINKFNNKSRLSSFCLMLLIFKYLQTDDVLPILKKQRQFNRYKVLLDVDDKSNEYNAYLNKRKSSKKRCKIRKRSLSALLAGFFHFYSEFDYDNCAISLFHKDVVEKKGGGNKGSYRDLNQRELPRSRLVFVIEYPLQTNYNCAMNVSRENAMRFKLECLRAKLILQSGNMNLEDICKSAT